MADAQRSEEEIVASLDSKRPFAAQQRSFKSLFKGYAYYDILIK